MSRFRQVMRSDSVLLDEAALAISGAVQAGVDEIEWLAALDLLAGECPTPTPDGIARYLFGELEFCGNTRAYYDWRNSCLDRVIETRTGIPISLSVLMIEVARRVGVELVGVGMPAHFLVGVVDQPGVYYDPFDSGRRLDRAEAQEVFERVTRHQVRWDDVYLEPTANRDIVIRMLNNLKSIFAGRNDGLRLALVMRMRAEIPELAESEADEIDSAFAILN